MTREEFTENRSALMNEKWVPLGKMAECYQKLLVESAPVDQIDVLGEDGKWYKKLTGRDHFMPARIYRLDPDWEGPAEPVEPPKPRYIDLPVNKDSTSMHFVELAPFGILVSLSQAPLLASFAGFVYDGKTESRLLFRMDEDTVKPIVPDAVRFHTTEAAP